MKTLNIREWKVYSKSQILKLLGNDEGTFEKLLKYAIIDKFEGKYQFNYVGIIIIDNFVINCYPKYFTNYSSDEFKQVVRVIKKYKSHHEEIDYHNEELDDVSFNLLSMMIFFLEDYYEYGVYNNIQNILDINGSGEIDWNRTINYTDPIIKGNKPYYVELFTKRKIDDLYDYFRLLHEYIITRCSKRLKKAGLIDLFDLTPVEISDKERDDFGEIELILEKLEKEFKIEFNSHKQKLLKSMHTFLKQDNSFSNENYLTIFGTDSYHVIWEEMCKKVFGDKLNNKLGELDLDLAEKYNPKIRLIDIIEKPIWYYKDEFPNEAKGTFIPDIVTFWRDNFVILDAKYYNLKFGENYLSGQPGLESITKQYLYELAYMEFIGLHDFKGVKNAFLLPKPDGEIEKLGHVELKILNLVYIQVIILPANLINNMYLNNEKMDISKLCL